MNKFIGIAILNYGEKVMGEFCEPEGDEIEVYSPFGLREVMTEKGSHTFIPYFFFPISKEIKSIKIKRSAFCIEPYKIDEQLESIYKQITSNLLIPPNKNIIV